MESQNKICRREVLLLLLTESACMFGIKIARKLFESSESLQTEMERQVDISQKLCQEGVKCKVLRKQTKNKQKTKQDEGRLSRKHPLLSDFRSG